MKKLVLLTLIAVLGLSAQAYSHSGRTDKNGGHNCSAKSQQKGLCSGYHYHYYNNGGIEYIHSDVKADDNTKNTDKMKSEKVHTH